MDEQPENTDRRNLLIAIVLIAVGAVFLIGELFNVRFGSGFWPFLFIVPGVLLLISAFNSRPAVAGTAIGGAVLTTLGLIFWYQVVSRNWESWAYIWALLPLSAGVAQMVVGARNDDESLAAQGRQVARIGGIMFIVGVVFFELIIFDRGGFGGYFLPLVLIAIGAFILWRHYNQGGELPWQNMFRGPDSPSRSDTPPSPAQSTPPATATPPRQAAVASPPPASEPFPEAELPHTPASDDTSFPVDEQSPEVPSEAAAAETPPPATETPAEPPSGAGGTGSSATTTGEDAPATPAAKPKRTTRRRTTTTRKSTTRKRPPREG